MTLYAETSAVLRWLFDEAESDTVLEHLREADKVVCSRLTLIESHRSIRRAVVAASLRETEAAEARSVLAQAAARWAILEISADIAARAEQAFPIEPIRTLDAIHLASALLLRHRIPDLWLLSTDGRVRANGSELGFELLPLPPGG